MPVSLRKSSLLLCLCASLLAACGSAPTVRDSKVLGANVAKVQSLQFIYRNADMRTTSSSSYGRGAFVADTGFNSFGAQLVKQVQPVFTPRGVAVSDAKVIDGAARISVDTPPLATAAGLLPQILIITPVSGKVSATGHATTASYVFSAQLYEPNTRRMVWRASIDTTSWSGQDVVLRNAGKTLYDEAYAAKLLEAVAVQMKADGIL